MLKKSSRPVPQKTRNGTRRKGCDESAPETMPARHRHIAAVPARQRASDREAEAGTFGRAHGIGAPETVEDPLEILRRNPHAGVTDCDEDLTALPPAFEPNVATGTRIAQRILEQIS